VSSAPPIADEPAAAVLPPEPPGGLHRPWRALLALAELIAAGAAVWGALLCWPHATATITLVLDDGTKLESVRYFGNWMAAAIGLGTVAALLVLDVPRQLVLAVRVRRRRPSKHAAAPS
jgi:hypothetical protein